MAREDGISPSQAFFQRKQRQSWPMLSTELQLAPPDMSHKLKLNSKLIRNRDRHTRKFQQLHLGQRVWMQHPHTKEWYQQATVTDILQGGQTYRVQGENGATYTRGARLLRPARQQLPRHAKARSVTAQLLYSSRANHTSSYRKISKPTSIMPKATYKTKGVSPSLISDLQHQHSQPPVTDQAWDLTLPKVSGDRGNNQSSIDSHLGNLGGGPLGPTSSSQELNSAGVQPNAVSQEQQLGESGGVLHTRRYQAPAIPAIPPPQQHGRIQFEGAGEIHGGGTTHETNERLTHDQHSRRITPVFNDGESSGCTTYRKFIRAVPIDKLQDLQKLQEEDKRGKSTQKDKQAKRGYGGDGVEQQQQSHDRTITNFSYSTGPISNYTNLRSYRPPQRGGVKRMADGHFAHAATASKRLEHLSNLRLPLQLHI